MGTHVVATGPIYPEPWPPQKLQNCRCRWLNGIWCVHKLLKQLPTLYKSKMENHLTEVVRSKPRRPSYRGKHCIPPLFGPFWAYSRTLPQGVELLV